MQMVKIGIFNPDPENFRDPGIFRDRDFPGFPDPDPDSEKAYILQITSFLNQIANAFS